MPGFLKLEDFLAPPPFPAIIAILMVLGFKYLGRVLVRPLRTPAPPSPGILEAAGFIAVTALTAAFVHLLALLGWAYVWPLRLMAWSLAAGGIMELSRWRWESFREVGRRLKAIFLNQSAWGKAAIVILAVAAAGLWLSTLGPPTDADSLDYHLGVPLEVLRRHGVFAAPRWFNARLAGLGEYLNLLGLAGGTDILGASLQFAGVVAILAAFSSFALTDTDRILLFLCVLGCPTLGFLVPNQKPQMLPEAATTVALLLIAQRFSRLNAPTILLAATAALFAMSCKYTLMLTAGVVVGALLIAAYRSKLLAIGVGAILAGYLLFLFPVHLQNLLLYGDPITPFLERFRVPSDAAMVRYAAKLVYAAKLDSFRILTGDLFPFPLDLILPSSPRLFTRVLGIGPLLWFLAAGGFREKTAIRVLLISAFLGITAIIIFGQISARYLLEPYLWSVPAIAAAAWRPGKRFFFKAMVGQTACMALVAGFGAVSLFPGALSWSLRDRVMTNFAYEYPEACWLDRVTPVDAVILLGSMHSCALLPRPFVSADRIKYSNLDQSDERRGILELLRREGVNTLVAEYPVKFGFLSHCITDKISGPKEFQMAVRNPWNRGSTREMAVYRLDLNHGECLLKGVEQAPNR